MENDRCGMGPLGPVFTDFYELTMLAGYFARGKQDQPAVFEFFFRRLPRDTGVAVFAGLEDLLNDLSDYRFSESELEYLDSLGVFHKDFIEQLRDFRFEGDVWAPQEGTPIFPYEPVVRVHAPLTQAQVAETLVICRLSYQTLIATKASRVRFAAGDDPVLEFGMRRAQGPDGAMSGTRAAMIGGCDATSNTLAGKCFGVQAVGTQAHSWIMAFPSELEAFQAYVSVFPEHPILLADTYDTLSSGVPNAIRVFTEMRRHGWKGRPGIRIDSGDLAKLSKAAHKLFVEAGFHDPLIVASSELDENLIANIKQQGAKVNSWGVGTKLVTGGTEPALGGVYKLAAICENGQWQAKLKISDNPEKTTDPGIIMPVRFYNEQDHLWGDVLFNQDDESWHEGEVISRDRMVFGQTHLFPAESVREPLLRQVMQCGKRLSSPLPVSRIRSFALEQMARVPMETRRLVNPQVYWIGLSDHLGSEKQHAIESFWRTHPSPHGEG